MRPLAIALTGAVCLFVSAAGAATLEGSVSVDGKPAVLAVVYLDASVAKPPITRGPHVVMDQKDLTFLPPVLPVVRGTVVEFTNSDDVQHNVFSPSESAGKFNLGTSGPGATHAVTLDQAGDVLVLCNIHMEMEAHILVLDGPYFATVSESGHYRIPDVPAGSYKLKLWQSRWLSYAETVDLPATGNVTASIVVGK